MSDPAIVIIEEKTESLKAPKTPKQSKPLEVTKAMSLLITNAVNEIEAKKAKRQGKKAEKIEEPKEPKEHKKTKKELEQEAKAHLAMCKGKTKDNKECTRKESDNCNGFCKQHFNIQKDKENTIELIEKHMK
jgi:hypothetical protein